MSSLDALFPDGDYRFHLTLRRGEPADFFRPQDPSGRVLRERARWLDTEPRRYLGLEREGEGLVGEFARMVREWEIAAGADGRVSEPLAGARSYESLGRLGRGLEPDILFLAADADGQFRLRGGALCFPTGWALEEKLGHTMDFIHGVVPGLNGALGPAIHQFLAKLKPGAGFFRDNWGLSASDELNLHPVRGLSPPQPPVALERLWLRVEHQVLLRLPRTGGIVFGIRIAQHRLDAIPASAAIGLSRGLETMPAALASYKRLDGIRSEVIRLLRRP